MWPPNDVPCAEKRQKQNRQDNSSGVITRTFLRDLGRAAERPTDHCGAAARCMVLFCVQRAGRDQGNAFAHEFGNHLRSGIARNPGFLVLTQPIGAAIEICRKGISPSCRITGLGLLLHLQIVFYCESTKDLAGT